jgi:hypothetical protein
MNRRLVGALLILAVAAIGVRLLLGESESPFDWSWRDAPLVPGVAVGGPGGAVAVLDAPGALWAADLLATTGVLGVGRGEGPASVRVALGEPSCAAAMSRATAGVGVVLGPGCLTALEDLGVPAPTGVSSDVLEATGVGSMRLLGPMPVAAPAAVWLDKPVGWEPLITIAGRPAALSRGRVVVLAVDPAAQARALRQGDPGLADRDTDGFHGAKPNDLRPFPWSLEAWQRPGAASWTEVLIAALEIGAGQPLPRLWPLLSEAPSALVMTSDQDFVETSWIDPVLARVEAAGGEMTVLTTVATRQSNSAPVDGGGGQGPPDSAWDLRIEHGVGVHPNVAGLDPRDAEAVIVGQLNRLADFEVNTARMHYLSWWGHSGPLPLFAKQGLAMDLTFVGIEPRFGVPGFGFGAARPMRWHDGATVLPIWVQPTHIEDDVLIGDLSYAAGLTPAEAVTASAGLLDRAMEHRVALVANLHPMLVAKYGGVLLDGLLAAAQDRGLPIASAERQAASATARLIFANEATVKDDGGVWVIDGPEVAAPVWLWTAGAECEAALAIRPGGPVGCLTAAPHSR